MEKEKKGKRLNIVAFVIGSIALAAAAMYVVPVIIDSSSSYIYKKMPSKVSDNEWGDDPVKVNKYRS